MADVSEDLSHGRMIWDYGGTIIGPVAAASGWQAQEGPGFENAALTMNWEARTATCPQGKRRR
jgi:hypothetical protein